MNIFSQIKFGGFNYSLNELWKTLTNYITFIVKNMLNFFYDYESDDRLVSLNPRTDNLAWK